jgi:hypothetical protein
MARRHCKGFDFPDKSNRVSMLPDVFGNRGPRAIGLMLTQIVQRPKQIDVDPRCYSWAHAKKGRRASLRITKTPAFKYPEEIATLRAIHALGLSILRRGS